jgi:hypothetical protein
MHHLSWQSEQGWIMDPSQCSSQNRQSGPLGCSLGGVVTVVGDAMLKMIVGEPWNDNDNKSSHAYELPVTASWQRHPFPACSNGRPRRQASADLTG